MSPRFLALASLAVLLGGCTSGNYMSGPGYTVRTPDIHLTTSSSGSSGSWNARLGDIDGKMDSETQFFFSVFIEDASSGATVNAMTSVRSMLFLVPKRAVNGPVSGVITADAGTLKMDGVVTDGKAAGSWTVSPDAQFASLFGSPAPAWATIRFILADIKRDRVKGFQDALGGGLSAKEVLRLADSGMQPEYAAEVVRGGMPREVDGLVRLRNAGVPAEMPGKLKSAGYSLSPEDIVRLRNSGMTAEDATGWKQAGFDLPVADLVRLRNSGLRPDFGKAMRDAGRDFPVDQMIRLRNAGVTPAFLGEISKVSPAWGAEEIIRARNSGLNPDFIKEWTKAGYNLTLDEQIRLRNAGVPVEYARAIAEAGGKPLSVDRLIELRNKGVSAETVRSLISSGRQ